MPASNYPPYTIPALLAPQVLGYTSRQTFQLIHKPPVRPQSCPKAVTRPKRQRRRQHHTKPRRRSLYSITPIPSPTDSQSITFDVVRISRRAGTQSTRSKANRHRDLQHDKSAFNAWKAKFKAEQAEFEATHKARLNSILTALLSDFPDEITGASLDLLAAFKYEHVQVSPSGCGM